MPIASEETKENIRAANDIVDVIGSYITVKRAGSTYQALCPFHKEKTPSFKINQRSQSFHCFGCGAGGDVFGFIMKHEGVDFPTAMKMLAERAGIAIRYSKENSQKRSDKEVLYSIHEKLAEFYHKILLENSCARQAREYMQDRQIDAGILEAFQIGYAPNRNTMMEWARRNKFGQSQMVKAGVLVQKEGDAYDRFRGRIMFPICDAMGRVIGFSGRVLKKDQSPAKYLNSSETLLFKKSRVLYGLHRARKPIIDAGSALVCEGQLDCIRCQMAGFENAIAPQGTALTAEQAHIVKRLADSVVLLFDPDEAGQKAAIRSSEIMLAEGLSVRVATLPTDSDPDTLIRSAGRDALQEIIDQSKSAVQFQIDTLSTSEDISSNAGLMRVSRAAMQMIAQCESAIQRDRLVQEAAELLGISASALLKDLANVKRKDNGDVPARPRRKTKYPSEELAAIQYLCANPGLHQLACAYLDQDSFTSPPCRKIFEQIIRNGPAEQSGLARTVDQSDSSTAELAARLDAQELPCIDQDYSPDEAFKHIIIKLRYNTFKRERDAIKNKASRSQQDAERQARLTHWMSSLKKFLHSRDWEKTEILLKTIPKT